MVWFCPFVNVYPVWPFGNHLRAHPASTVLDPKLISVAAFTTLDVEITPPLITTAIASTKKLAIIHDDDEKQGEYEINIENTDKVETGTWSWNDDGYITLYQDNDAIANLVYVDGKYLFSDADIEIQKLKRISETAIVK